LLKLFKRPDDEEIKPRLKGQAIIDFIIYRSKLIEKIFAVLFVIAAICFPFVNINYDLSKYLPADMPSKQGISLMEKEFGYPGIARVMLSDVSIYEAKAYKDRIKNIKGVDLVLWADSKTDIYQADKFIPYRDIEDYYKDGYAVMDVVFTGGESDQSTRDAIQEMKNMLGEKGAFSGPAVQNKFLSEVIPQEMIYILILGVMVIFGILILTTNSWFEPVIFLIVILISIVINMGSNLIFGNISSMTLSVAAVLQLAIAMDYTIILLDNFNRERKNQLPVTEALSNAIRSSVTPVSSAGAAAFVGFIVLVLMRFSIGRDIGLVLAKGIVISLITIMLLTPAFILRWYKLIERTEHKPLVPAFAPIARKIYRFRFVFLILLLITSVPAYIGKDMTDFTFGNDAMGLSKGTIVFNDERKTNAVFGRNNIVMIIMPNTSMVTERLLSDELENRLYVKYVTSLANSLPEGIPESFIPDSVKGSLHTEKYARMLVSLKTASESDLACNSINEISQIVKKHYPEDSYIIGATPSTMDIKDVIVDDWTKIDLISMLGVALAIMIAFRSLALPLVLMIPIQMAIFVNMTFPYLAGKQIMFMGYVIVSCLQLGATIDYSIVMTYHYLEWRKKTDKVTASINAATDSMLPILTSGLILAVAGFGVSFVSSVQAIKDLGTLIGRGALLSVFMVITLLPNLFIWSDQLINFKGKKLLPAGLGKVFGAKRQSFNNTKDMGE